MKSTRLAISAIWFSVSAITPAGYFFRYGQNKIMTKEIRLKTKYAIISAVMIMLIPTIAFAGYSGGVYREPATKLEIYLAQKEKLLITDIFPLGELKEPPIAFEAIITRELGSPEKFGGLRVYTPTSRGMDFYFAYLDSNAIDSLLNAVISMTTLHKEQPLGPNESEKSFYFSCRGGFTVELRKSPDKQRILIGGRVTTIALEPPDFNGLRSILEKARDILRKNEVTDIPEDKFREQESKTTP